MEKEEQLTPGDIVTVAEDIEGLLSQCFGRPEYWLEPDTHAILMTDPGQPVTFGTVMCVSFIDPYGKRRWALVELDLLEKVPEKEIASPERAERQYVRREGAVTLSPLAGRSFVGPALFERGTDEWELSAGKYRKVKRKKGRKKR